MSAGCVASESSATGVPTRLPTAVPASTASPDSARIGNIAADEKATPPPQPQDGGYQLEPVWTQEGLDWMLGFEMFPGSQTSALTIAKTGEVWLVDLTGRAGHLYEICPIA